MLKSEWCDRRSVELGELGSLSLYGWRSLLGVLRACSVPADAARSGAFAQLDVQEAPAVGPDSTQGKKSCSWNQALRLALGGFELRVVGQKVVFLV